ncbi:MAG: HAMP domain-containing histidine kinase, partial [Proteobacteria bacterium]|nr:HAMP domain-containing histidine kinase [Pseudomonadota bacterium]
SKDRDLEIETADVAQFAHEVIGTIETRMRGANIACRTQYHESLGEFDIDRELARTALLNILENALEACIEDPDQISHRVDYRVRSEGDDVLFEIADDGPGMEPDQIKKIFTLFFSSKGKRGTGLGLFITHKVIKQHGGSVRVESSPGRGTVFRVRLPRKPPGRVA